MAALIDLGVFRCGDPICLTRKLLLRQTTGRLARLLKLANLDWAVPDETTLCRRQKTLAVHIAYRRADGRLNLMSCATTPIQPKKVSCCNNPACAAIIAAWARFFALSFVQIDRM